MKLARIGVIYPDDGDADSDFYEMAPAEVSLHVTRNAGWSPTYGVKSVDVVAGLRGHFDEGHLAEAADRLAPISPDVVAYGCLSCSFVGGVGYDAGICADLSERLGCPATTGTTALLAGLRALHLERVAVVSSYDDTRNAIFYEVLKDIGVEVVASASCATPGAVRDFYESLGMHGVSQVRSPEVAYHLGKRVDVADAQGVVITSTNFRTGPMIAPLERDLGKPVITANQSVIWHSLELAGVRAQDHHYGALFQCQMPTRVA